MRRLRSAGAVILGKTHVPEMMIVPFTETPTFGITRNPWDLQRTPGGSSGGSAAAVAAGPVLGGARLRRRRLDPHPGRLLRAVRPQAAARPRADRAHCRAVARALTWGPITRRVADSARFYDAIRDGGESFTDAAAREPGRLRIAITSNVPPVMARGPTPSSSARCRARPTCCARSATRSSSATSRWGPVFGNFLARYLRGVHDEAAKLPHPERLSRRTRGYMRMGGADPATRCSPGPARRRRRTASAPTAIFADGFDLVVMPLFARRPPKVMYHDGRTRSGR